MEGLLKKSTEGTTWMYKTSWMHLQEQSTPPQLLVHETPGCSVYETETEDKLAGILRSFGAQDTHIRAINALLGRHPCIELLLETDTAYPFLLQWLNLFR